MIVKSCLECHHLDWRDVDRIGRNFSALFSKHSSQFCDGQRFQWKNRWRKTKANPWSTSHSSFDTKSFFTSRTGEVFQSTIDQTHLKWKNISYSFLLVFKIIHSFIHRKSFDCCFTQCFWKLNRWISVKFDDLYFHIWQHKNHNYNSTLIFNKKHDMDICQKNINENLFFSSLSFR